MLQRPLRGAPACQYEGEAYLLPAACRSQYGVPPGPAFDDPGRVRNVRGNSAAFLGDGSNNVKGHVGRVSGHA